jgi:FSR family fosmidomycin resistance protein-like MFS transporter
LTAISFSHLLNDTIQSLLPGIYPLLKATFQLSFSQVGLITFTLMVSASVLQPIVGLITDRRPAPYSLVTGMSCSLAGLLVLSTAGSLSMLLVAAALIGLGSAIFHPESSRVARLASGGRHGLAQSVFQVGGNAGSSLGPLLAAFVVVPYGQASIAWCSIVAIVAIGLLWRIGRWHKARIVADSEPAPAEAPAASGVTPVRVVRRLSSVPISRRQTALSLAILIALIFSKYFYMSSLTSFYTFYLMSKFGVTIRAAQFDLFVFLAAVAAGTILGGPLGDRFGRKWIIWASIVGALPFTLALPYASLFWTRALSVMIGLVIASAFSAILVYAQELIPNRVGLIAGLFFGFAFGMAGIGAAVLGELADRTSIEFVYRLCAFLPAIGLLTALLPDLSAEVRTSK